MANASQEYVDATIKRLLVEWSQLMRHTHGFAYPECPKCARLEVLGKILGKTASGDAS